MSYLNGQTGYREELLSTRSVVKKDNWVLLEPDGLVKNVVPGYENCDVTILGTPAMGASFADYLVTVHENGRNTGIGGNGIESFLYVIEGEICVDNGDESVQLTAGGYIYSPADKPITFEKKDAKDATLYVYKRRYEVLDDYRSRTCIGNVNDMEWVPYEEMDNCHVKDLLPKDLGFDMNMHILKFKPGASHGYIETHVQEHGMYFLSGKGMYRIDDEWIPVKKRRLYVYGCLLSAGMLWCGPGRRPGVHLFQRLQQGCASVIQRDDLASDCEL